MTTLGVVSHLHFQTLSCVVLRTVPRNQTGLDITGYDWIDTVTFVRGPRILSFAKKLPLFLESFLESMAGANVRRMIIFSF